MKQKNSKLNQMYSGQSMNQGHVFTNNNIMTMQISGKNNRNKPMSMDVDINKIITEKEINTNEISDETKESYLEYLVMPIILKPEYVMKEKGGRKFRDKTGNYILLDGAKRLAVYKEAGRLQIPSLILPVDISEEDEKKFIRAVKDTGVETAVREVKDFVEEDISRCYRYEIKNIEVDKIEERDNKYVILDSEVNELANSIYKIGLLQPIVVLPRLDEAGQVKYTIQAGHKRTRAVKKIIQRAKDGGWYKGTIDGRPESDIILEKFKTIPALIIPQGATESEVEQIYNETNLLSRHMTTDDVFVHFDYFVQAIKVEKDVFELQANGKRKKIDTLRVNFPTKPEENEALKWAEDWQMNHICDAVQQQFKKLGFKDWKNTRTTTYLDIYFYGSPELLNKFSNLEEEKKIAKMDKRKTFTVKDLDWVCTKYKGNYQEQNRLISLSYEDFLREKVEKRDTRKSTAKLKNEFIGQNARYKKILTNKKDEKIIISDDDLKDIEGIKSEIRLQKRLLEELIVELEKLKK